MAEAKTTKKKFATLAEALVAFQENIPVPTKDAKADVGKYGYDYASLDKLTPLILGKLASVGIAYTAAPDLTELGFGLRATLIHESGESTGGFYPLGNPNAPAQAIGSAITYARRYALLSLTGVAPTGEDDDGASAHVAQEAINAKAAAAAGPARETAASVQEEMGNLINNSGGVISGDDANAVMSEVAPEKTAAQWTLTDLKKGRDKLAALLAERQGS